MVAPVVLEEYLQEMSGKGTFVSAPTRRLRSGPGLDHNAGGGRRDPSLPIHRSGKGGTPWASHRADLRVVVGQHCPTR
jgi:hypothetical protein